jgi:PTH1 family peptidyl-tRNA hydrolase
MKLIIGLGNPGGEYKNSRHSAGRMFVDWATSQGDALGTEGVALRKADCFMNDSGKGVAKIFKEAGGVRDFGDLYIAHDDLDIRLGNYKIQFGKGPELHYGVQSVEKKLGTKGFWRIRIGVDNRPVLPSAARAKKEERRILGEEVFPKVGEDLQDNLKFTIYNLK